MEKTGERQGRDEIWEKIKREFGGRPAPDLTSPAAVAEMGMAIRRAIRSRLDLAAREYSRAIARSMSRVIR